jgi:hypothetical protein
MDIQTSKDTCGGRGRCCLITSYSIGPSSAVEAVNDLRQVFVFAHPSSFIDINDVP